MALGRFAAATEEMQGDREVVMSAVAQSGLALEYATEEMRGDREVVMSAVAEDAYALQYATEEMKGDREVVMAAVVTCSPFCEFWVGHPACHRGDEM